MHRHIYVCVYIYTHLYMCVCIYIYIYMKDNEKWTAKKEGKEQREVLAKRLRAKFSLLRICSQKHEIFTDVWVVQG